MALIRVAQYSSTPTVVGDYQAQNAHLQAFTNQLMTKQFILDSGTAQPVIKQGCYVSHGGSLYIADADTSITGSPSDGSVYIRVSGTTSLTVEFVTDISGYTWNPAYTALTSGSYTLLPYLIVKASTVWTRYNFNPNNQSFGDTRLNSLAVLNNATIGGTLGVTGAIGGASLGVTGAISGASIDTGYGANKVYKHTDDVLTLAASGGSGTVVNLPSMNTGEIKMMLITLINPDQDGLSVIVRAPNGGTYFYIASGYSTLDNHPSGGTISGNSNLFSNSSRGSTFSATLYIRRIE